MAAGNLSPDYVTSGGGGSRPQRVDVLSVWSLGRAGRTPGLTAGEELRWRRVVGADAETNDPGRAAAEHSAREILRLSGYCGFALGS